MEISLKRFNGKIGLASNKTNNICQTRYQLLQKEEKRREKVVGWQKISLHDIRLMFFLHLYF